MTAAELAHIPGDTLSVSQVSKVLGCDPDTLRGQAREYPELLGFPVSCMGKRVIIPKVPFLRFMGVIE